MIQRLPIFSAIEGAEAEVVSIGRKDPLLRPGFSASFSQDPYIENLSAVRITLKFQAQQIIDGAPLYTLDGKIEEARARRALKHTVQRYVYPPELTNALWDAHRAICANSPHKATEILQHILDAVTDTKGAV